MSLSLPKYYEYQLTINNDLETLFVGLAVGNKFQEPLIRQVFILSIKDRGKTLLLYNIGSLCKKIADFILHSRIKKVVLFGSNNAAYATIIWSFLLSQFLHKSSIDVGFVAINPNFNLKDEQFSPTELLGVKNYLNFDEVLHHYKQYPVQGFIYLPVGKQDEYFTDSPNIRVFYTNYLEQDINYFVKRSVSCSANYVNIVKRQYMTTGRNYWREDADRYLENNVPTLQSLINSLVLNESDNFLMMGDFDIIKYKKPENVIFISQISQLINALYWKKNYVKMSRTLLVVEYTQLNLNTPKMIFDHYLRIKKDFIDLDMVFFEIPIFKTINFNIFQYFEIKYKYILNIIKSPLIVINSMLNRSAILGNVAKTQSKVYLIEEGLGTYLQINQIKRDKMFGDNYIFNLKYNYVEKSLILNFGSVIMKESLKGFLNFDKFYLTFTNAIKQKNDNVVYFNHIQLYVDENIYDPNIKKDILNNTKVNNNEMVLYIDQDYGVDGNIFYQIIITILLKMYQKEKIFIIMHPKNQHNKHHIVRLSEEMNVSDRIFLLDLKGKYKAELIISLVNPKSICSLCSSTLVYCRLLQYQGDIISITPSVLQELEKLNYHLVYEKLKEYTKALNLVDTKVNFV